jgi:hypothetical protein
LANRHAAYAKLGNQLSLGGQAPVFRIATAFDLRAQRSFELLVQRDRMIASQNARLI